MSGRKNRLVKYQIVTAGDMSQASITSKVTNIQGLDLIGIQINFSGAPVGTFDAQVSIDYAQDLEGNVTNPGSWTAIAFAVQPSTASGSPVFLDIQNISAPWIKTVYTKTSGTGTMSAFITGKQ